MECKVIKTIRKKDSISFQGTCGNYEFEANISIEPFPSKKHRDRAYKVWVETFLRAMVNKFNKENRDGKEGKKE